MTDRGRGPAGINPGELMIYTSPMTFTPMIHEVGEPRLIECRWGMWCYYFHDKTQNYQRIDHNERECCPTWSNDECRCMVEPL